MTSFEAAAVTTRLTAPAASDLIDFSDGAAAINFTLTQSASATAFNTDSAGRGTDAYSNIEGVIGTAYNDTLTGSASADQLRGGGGNDVISGMGGDDRIVGGPGADAMTGGTGSDTFVFDTASNAVDTVIDFNASGSAGSGDFIELSLATFGGAHDGEPATRWRRTSSPRPTAAVRPTWSAPECM